MAYTAQLGAIDPSRMTINTLGRPITSSIMRYSRPVKYFTDNNDQRRRDATISDLLFGGGGGGVAR